MNRILLYLGSATERRRRRTAAAETVCSQLKALTGEIIDVFVPESDDEVRLAFCLNLEVPSTSDLEHAAQHLATELLSIADSCLVAADALEGKGGVA